MSGGSFDAILTNGMAMIGRAAEAAGRSVAKTKDGLGAFGAVGEKEFKKIGAAINQMGGPLAQVVGKFFGAVGLEGGLGRLAMAATVAGVAFKALTSVMAVAEGRAQAFAAASAGLREAALSAEKANRSLSAGGSGIGKSLAVAETMMGADAGQRATSLAKTYNVPYEDVIKSMGHTATVPKELRALVLETAAKVAASGEFTMEETIKQLSDRGTRDRVLGAGRGEYAGIPLPAGVNQAATLLQMMRGAYGQGSRAEAINTIGNIGVGAGPAGSATPGVIGAENIVPQEKAERYKSRATESAIRTEASAALNPLAAALQEWKRKQDEAIQQQIDAANALGPVLDSLKNLDLLFGGEGSHDFQGRKLQGAAGRAVNGMGGQ